MRYPPPWIGPEDFPRLGALLFSAIIRVWHKRN